MGGTAPRRRRSRSCSPRGRAPTRPAPRLPPPSPQGDGDDQSYTEQAVEGQKSPAARCGRGGHFSGSGSLRLFKVAFKFSVRKSSVRKLRLRIAPPIQPRFTAVTPTRGCHSLNQRLVCAAARAARCFITLRQPALSASPNAALPPTETLPPPASRECKVTAAAAALAPPRAPPSARRRLWPQPAPRPTGGSAGSMHGGRPRSGRARCVCLRFAWAPGRGSRKGQAGGEKPQRNGCERERWRRRQLRAAAAAAGGGCGCSLRIRGDAKARQWTTRI